MRWRRRRTNMKNQDPLILESFRLDGGGLASYRTFSER
jgi:hypothetical protein